MSTSTDPRDTSAIGKNPIPRNPTGQLIRGLMAIVQSPFVQKRGLTGLVNKAAFEGTKHGFKALGAANRTFKKVGSAGKPQRLTSSTRSNYDLTPDEDQKMIVDTIKDFAAEILRPAAHDADEATKTPEDLGARAAELGITLINIPEELEGAGTDRGVVTNALVAEALAYGDMGLALPILAPSGVAVTLAQFGSDGQQRTYLPEFAGEKVPQASVVISEPTALFNPFTLATKATRTQGGYILNGVKSLVPEAGSAELFIVGADLEGTPALFIVESGTEGVVVEGDPSMGLRAASLGRLNLNTVKVPDAALLGEVDRDTAAKNYTDVVRLARLGWSALALGTSRAVLDYVTPYVKEREAFGEPIAHRQAVAFAVADMATEIDGLELLVWRGAARAEQGLSFGREAALARRFATDKGMKIGLDGVQLLGGHGYTKEHPVERWYRDLRAVGIAEGIVVL
ncbi:acyl-CoA dehydrogenase family protein [Tsukamurella sp. 8F]|uniref:acyl-CoA dehydrogenase family protein n=1 Tax=unclassified Tsukamurella TaxID=2633480 RepID=UPI0023B8BC0C|nr:MULTISPECIES: acyl-CoA dehydrogenase family protein [unclassified Tsukamurella]MDF0528863.1 acyl-CoA dehydrogenase family protein [Tsukamurella sp. 8J]MDF0586698.1 acyl-CoA dehydrogenase family protein [Tsukamurella sp. 8F]